MSTLAADPAFMYMQRYSILPEDAGQNGSESHFMPPVMVFRLSADQGTDSQGKLIESSQKPDDMLYKTKSIYRSITWCVTSLKLMYSVRDFRPAKK